MLRLCYAIPKLVWIHAEPVRAGGGEFVAAAVAPEDADAGDAVGVGAFDVVATVADHAAVVGAEAFLFEEMGDQVGLIGALAGELAAVEAVEETGEVEMVQDVDGVDAGRFRRGEQEGDGRTRGGRRGLQGCRG